MINVFLFWFFCCTINTPLEDKLINSKAQPISAKFVIVLWWSWMLRGGNLWSNEVPLWWARSDCSSWTKKYTYSVCVCVCVWFGLVCFLIHSWWHSSVFILSLTAYQLRTCQPPPPVANASILTEDDEFEIGLSQFIIIVHNSLTTFNKITFHQAKMYLLAQL